jgi:MYXO-CTERM domain-containing protein
MKLMKNTQIGLVVGVTAILTLASGVAAQAQSLRPNILFVFDTSGSMLNGGKDGSPLCAGGGGTSRIYALKKALREALAQVGTDEANFGLMRYPQTVNLAVAPVCPQGHYATGANTGCRLTSQSTNQTTYGVAPSWFDDATNGISQALVVPVTKATALKPVDGTYFDPVGANISTIYQWIDLTESGNTSGGPITDPELRSPSTANTPIGRSLFYARLYFDNYVKAKDAMGKALDPKALCRKNLVIFVTDGGETCDNTKTAGATLDASCNPSVAGGFATFHPELQACQLRVLSGVPTYILTDSTLLTAAEKTEATNIATQGGTTLIDVSLTNSDAVKAALINIIASTVPPPETCNGVDDNCNGLIDEGVSNSCTVTAPNNPNDPDNLLGTSAKHCAAEICDCKDNNCNGQIDEGCTMNACGVSTYCPVPPEICNGLDDNCDGDIDEGFNVGGACTNGGVGACLRGGIWLCNAAGGRTCDAPVVTPQPELCNNIDDNCNGQVDEGTLPGVGVACGTSLGNCRAGVTQCVNGKIICSTMTQPMNEICNGLDDNCDGVVDNGNFPETGMTCLCPGLDGSKVDVGTCKAGHLICRGTRGFVCEGCVLPGPEICDGLDNDCDGVADVNPICPSGLGCKEGRCALLCGSGEFPCPSGYKCVGDFCVPQRCAGKTCPTDQRCDENTGACVDVCAGVVCRDPKICQHGSCVDCYTLGCASGEMCNAGRCQIDKCAGVTCASNQYCDDGKCVDLCTLNKCAGPERCVAGACIPDKCVAVGCPSGQFCDQATAQCRNDTCQVTQCGRGERCIPETGACVADPCNLINCPGPCWQCTTTSDGAGTCTVSGDCKEVSAQIGLKGGGDGCGCAVGPSDGRGAGLGLLATMLGIAGVVSLRRRRR